MGTDNGRGNGMDVVDVSATEALAALLDVVRTKDAAGDGEGALGVLDDAGPSVRRMGSYHFTRGALLFRLGRLDEAIVAFEQAVEKEPEVAEFASNLGAALFERARRGGLLSGDSPVAQAGTVADAAGVGEDAGPAERRAALADLARASSLLEHAVSLSPRLPSVYSNLGLVRAVEGRAADALAAFDQALTLAPDDVATLYNRAAALSQLGELEECVRTLDRILALKPGFAPAQASRENTLRRLATHLSQGQP